MDPRYRSGAAHLLSRRIAMLGEICLGQGVPPQSMRR
jgi:hypothetical protein